MKDLFRTMAKAVRKSVFGEPTNDQVPLYFAPTADDEINDLLARVKAFNRVPLHKPTVEERKAEADTMRDLKAWLRKLSPNDRAIVAGCRPWEIMNHMLGIVPIDGVVAVGRGASYDFAPTKGMKNDFADKPQAANENSFRAAQVQVPKASTSFEARGLSQVAHQLRQKEASQPSMQQERKPEPTYAYEPPRPSAAFMAKFA
ncbi:hypothetical protein CN198_13885 [Sinorhizobium meliloti]|uniref:hypothetical protein n=1 Tax=Rhizobium meliloti TaxID=382 RepID=UPI000FD6CF61|nr:hypothetical protein [Sinorhizobium meliloti]RVH69152.1 hypothetical protein CN198_13885 [Sinorhizobium meliloti]